MERGMNYLWPTPLLFETVKDRDLLDRVTQALLQNIDFENPPTDFQTDFDILRDGPPELQEFKEKEIVPAFDRYLKEVCNIGIDEYDDYVLRGWITGTKGGYMLPYHNHSGSMLSSVFYILCEEEGKGGAFEALDPRANANRGYDKNFKHLFASKRYIPKSGDIAIFPSFMYHFTHPFVGSMRLAMPVDFSPNLPSSLNSVY